MENLLNDETNKTIYDEMMNLLESRKVINEEELIEKYNHHFLVFYFIGEYHNKLGHFDIAKDNYIRSFECNFKFSEAYMALAILLFKQGEYNDAEYFLKFGLVECPKDAKMLNFLGVILFMDYKNNKRKRG